MADKIQNRVGESVSGSIAAEIGNALSLDGALKGLQSFTDGYDLAGAVEANIPASLETGDLWQVGYGTYDDAANTFTFDTIDDSSSGGGAIALDDGSELRVTASAAVLNGVVASGPTNLGNIPASTAVTITSSTGSNTTVPAADGANAGMMTAAQVADLNSKAPQSGLDNHTGDGGIHFTEDAIDHQNITGAGTNTHADLDTHVADGGIHKTEAEIIHQNLDGAGANTHAQVDTHIGDATIHKTEGQIVHQNLSGAGTTTHANLDAHVADSDIHQTEAQINHQALNGAGTNAHAAIDSHLADGAKHYAEGDIDHDAIQNTGSNAHSVLDAHLADGGIHVPGGGLTGQVLTKTSNTPGDTEWGTGSGGGGGHVIQDDGASMAQRTFLNVKGAGVVVTDDPGNDATVITGGTGIDLVQNGGLPLPKQHTINFLSGLQAADDAGAGRSNVSMTFGTTSGTAAQGNDARFSDARDPLAHAASHAAGQSDAISHTALADIGTRSHAELETDISLTVKLNGIQTVWDRKTFRDLEFGSAGAENRLPSGRGAFGQVLETDGAGLVSWADKGSIELTSYVSDATSDGQGTVSAAWNDYADRQAVTKLANEIIYYTWPSTAGAVYQYLGNQQLPPWLSTPGDWLEVGSATVYANFPLDYSTDIAGRAVDPAGGNQAYLEKYAGADPQTVEPATTFAAGAGSGVDPSAATDLTRKSWIDTQLSGKKDDFTENSGFNKDFGALADTVTEGNDARLTDARDPNAHAASHASAGGDPVNHIGMLNVGTNTHAQIDSHVEDAGVHFAEISIDHNNIVNRGTSSHAVLDAHVGDDTLHFTEGSIDHQAVSGAGTNTHAQIDTHLADGTIHKADAQIIHQDLSGAGTVDHAAIDTHVGDSTLHFTEASIDHAAITNVGSNSHSLIDTHIADVQIHYAQTEIAHANLIGIGTRTHDQLETDIGAKLGAVEEDTAPALGGHIDTKGFDIYFGDGAGGFGGVIGNTTTGAGFGYTTDGTYNPTDGSVAVAPGKVSIGGSVALITALSGDNNRDVQVAPDGTLYAAELPVPGWSDSDSDNGDYLLAGLGVWVQITGLFATVQADVLDGDRVDVVSNLHVVENDGGRGGSIDVGFGRGGEPDTGINTIIPGGFDGLVPIYITTTTHGGLLTNDVITIWARRSTQEHNNFEPEIHGSSGGTHELTISIPGAGGGAGGDATNLGNTPGSDSVTITSSTGSNTVVAGAVSGTAGMMTGAQVDTLAASGDVSGPAGGTLDGHVALYADSTGKLLKGSSLEVNNVMALDVVDQLSTLSSPPLGFVPTDLIMIEDAAVAGIKRKATGAEFKTLATTDVAFATYASFAGFGTTVGLASPLETDISFTTNKQVITGSETIILGAFTFPGVGSYSLSIDATVTVASINPADKKEFGGSAYAFPAGKAHEIGILWDGTVAKWMANESVA